MHFSKALFILVAVFFSSCEKQELRTEIKETTLPKIVDLGSFSPYTRPLNLEPKTIASFRVVSYGNSQWIFSTQGGESASVVVDGPHEKEISQTPFEGVKPLYQFNLNQGNTGPYTFTFPRPGVYRVSFVPGATAATIKVTAKCVNQCVRPSISLEKALQRDPALVDLILSKLKKQFASLRNGEDWVRTFEKTLRAVALGQVHLDKFPTFSLAQMSELREVLMATLREEIMQPVLEPDEVPNPRTSEKSLAQMLGKCAPLRRPGPKIVDPSVLYLRFGEFADESISACDFKHSIRLAHILTELGNGTLTWKEKLDATQVINVDSPQHLAWMLMKMGHTIVAKNVRMHANFFAFTLGYENVIWPGWVDTEEKLPSGKKVIVPFGHSEHVWEISGPIVNTSVRFFLGTGGVGFFPNVGYRPAWTGLRAEYMKSSREPYGTTFVARTFEVASNYMKRIKKENATLRLANDGYGVTGVCNDSNAALEFLTRGSITTFPLTRSKFLDQRPGTVQDELSTTFQKLPYDADYKISVTEPNYRRGLLQRVYAMRTFETHDPMQSALLGEDFSQMMLELETQVTK